MTRPKISIILPVYNGADYLEESVKSCCKQRFKDWELIIVDDASTDRTQDIIRKYVRLDNRITCVRHDHNKRLPAALNSGFAVAKGEYFTWTSHDNRFLPQALDKMLRFLEENKSFSIVYSDFKIIDATGKDVDQFNVSPPEDLTLKNVMGPCFLYKSIVHHELNGYDEARFLVEDYDFWLRASKKFKIAPPLKKLLYEYRAHGDSLTARRSYEIQNALILLLARHLPDMWWAGCRKVSQGYARLAAAATRNGLIGWGVYYYVKSVILWPSPKNIIKAIIFVLSKAAHVVREIFSGILQRKRK
ncbi:MAG: glycosyltransferase [Sedimentisphaerales bacterium]|nr:glycosyltransferase [Sedimentisphaerales bacterium]